MLHTLCKEYNTCILSKQSNSFYEKCPCKVTSDKSPENVTAHKGVDLANSFNLQTAYSR